MAQRPELPELELACLKVLWEAGDLTVRGVRERLQPHRPLAYTTVMTVLDRLARKRAVSRRKVGRAHLYHAEYPRAAALDRALGRLLETYFDGSSDSLRSYLGGAPASPRRSPPAETLDEALL